MKTAICNFIKAVTFLHCTHNFEIKSNKYKITVLLFCFICNSVSVK